MSLDLTILKMILLAKKSEKGSMFKLTKLFTKMKQKPHPQCKCEESRIYQISIFVIRLQGEGGEKLRLYLSLLNICS